MALKMDCNIQDNILHHHYSGILTRDDVQRGIEAFYQANLQSRGEKIHVLIDLREIETHTLSIVDVYRFAEMVGKMNTGDILVLGAPNLVVRTLVSLATKVVEQVIPLPYRYFPDNRAFLEFCQYSTQV